jgi:alpha-galactosidase
MSELRPPDRVLFYEGLHHATVGAHVGETWSHAGTDVGFRLEVDLLAVEVHATEVAVPRIILRWENPPPEDGRFLGDHWERGYGDLEWRGLVSERVMPWYFLCHSREGTTGWGVRTRAAAFCFWTVDARGISLWIDLRSGTEGVRLGGRTLRAAEITTGKWTERPFLAARAFCRKLCPSPRLFPEPVYGGNDWYSTYGFSTHEMIVRDSAVISEMAGSAQNRPFSVIDDGWQLHGCSNGAPWNQAHPNFPDMARLAREIRQTGCRPGIWIRLLVTREKFPETWTLPQRAIDPATGIVLDPSVPEVLEKIRTDLQTMTGWGYELIKHDYSTYDIFNKWGFEMGATLTTGEWKFQDNSRTTAEIITGLYRAIREGAGDAVIIGCNTVGHLGAGLFEVQRTGDDTSGRNWERTRRMGINTLAFRMCQHETFFAADGDCVGLTRAVPWEANRQWLELLAGSGTALFVSSAPEAVGPEQKAAIRDAFAQASQVQEPAEPLDWMNDTCPRSWQIGGKIKTFDWMGEGGALPFNLG